MKNIFVSMIGGAVLLLPLGLAAEVVRDQWAQQLIAERGGVSVSAGDERSLRDTISDPPGDTTPSDTSPELDLLSMSAYTRNGLLEITLTFDLSVLPCEDNVGIVRPTEVSLNGFVDIDADGDSATGGASLSGAGLGIEYYVALCSYSSTTGEFGVYDASDDVLVGNATGVFGANTVSIQVPLEVIGDAANADLAVRVGTMIAATTDSSTVVAASPAPTGSAPTPVPVWGLFGLLGSLAGILGAGGWWLRRTRLG